MDLRKAIFLKKPLQDSISSLNSSSASIYESAAEDSDCSLYYSFSKSDLDQTSEENLSITSEAEKENTVILKESSDEKRRDSRKEQENMTVKTTEGSETPVIEISDDSIVEVTKPLPQSPTNATVEVNEEPIKEKVMDVDNEKEHAEKTAIENRELKEDSPMEVDEEPEPDIEKVMPLPDLQKSVSIPQIIIEDPNKNIINPFTMPTTESTSAHPHSTPKHTTSLPLDGKKKSATKIPTRTHFYSPVQRKSIDKTSKINFKPAQPTVAANALKRRTTMYRPYDTRSRRSVMPSVAPAAVPPPPSVAAPKTSSQPPKNASKPPPKAKAPATIMPTLFKCTFPKCTREFRLLKTYNDHQKMHASSAGPSNSGASSSTSSSSKAFMCEWCDKNFELKGAVIGHKLEKCPKIPFNEKRKLIAQEEKKEKSTDKRKSMFVAPAPKVKKSPSRRQTLNKSGILVTPKKTLNCASCGKVSKDVVEFANHMISHKYDKLNKNKV